MLASLEEQLKSQAGDFNAIIKARDETINHLSHRADQLQKEVFLL
jgi:hypothetical protein